jgi:hypothetical protein
VETSSLTERQTTGAALMTTPLRALRALRAYRMGRRKGRGSERFRWRLFRVSRSGHPIALAALAPLLDAGIAVTGGASGTLGRICSSGA